MNNIDQNYESGAPPIVAPATENPKPDDLADPFADLTAAADLMDVKNRTNIFVERIDLLKLKFCTASRENVECGDHEECSTVEDIDATLKMAKSLGVSITDMIPSRTGRSKSLPMIQWLYSSVSYHECLIGRDLSFPQKSPDGNVVKVPEIIDEEDVMGYLAWRIKILGVSQSGTIKRKLDTPLFYFEWKTVRYWRDINAGLVDNLKPVFQSLNETACQRKLRQTGLSSVPPYHGALSEVEHELIAITDRQTVEWAGRLAGYAAGLIRTNGINALITSGPDLVVPIKGKCETILSIVQGMLGETQKWYFYFWLKIYIEALMAGRTQHGQMVVFCGPADTLKSFLQHHVITPLFGGREADAARFLTGRSEFNSDLSGAEHNFLDDAKPYGNWLSRHDFSENLKSMIVGKGTSVHAKHKDGETLCPRRRITMSLNSDDEAIRSLPDLTESFADKVMLFECFKFKLPMPNHTVVEKIAFEKAVQSEISHFAWWLLNEIEIPDGYRSDRFGVVHYHALNLLEKLHEMSKEAELASIIDMADLTPSPNEQIKREYGRAWVGTAEELKRHLFQTKRTRILAERLLKWENSTGTLLGKLAKIMPTKVTRWEHKVAVKHEDEGGTEDKKIKKREWIIIIPERDNAPDYFDE